MVCSKCGAQLKEGCIYCSRCGQEAQIVSEISILEDDLLRKMMDGEDETAEPNPAGGEQPDLENGVAPARRKIREKQRKREKKKRKKMIRLLISLIAILAAAVIAVFCVIRYQHNHSAEYLLEKAQNAYSQKDYTGAEKYLERLLALDGEHPEALLLEGQISLAQNDYESAKQSFLSVIALDASNADAYEGLIAIYEAQGQTDEILALKDTVTDEDILELFADYIVACPELSVESGSFSEYFTVEITAPEDNLEIYYTLDQTTPTSESTLYEEPVEISEQGTTVLTAVCMNEDGIYSDPVTAEYEIELDAPDAPSVSPDGGQFSMPATITIRVPDGTTVYYTWDASNPDENDSVYTSPLSIPEGNHVLSVIAIDEYGMKSSVMKYNYIYYPTSQADDTDAETIDGGE